MSLPSFLNKTETPLGIKTKSIYLLPLRFYLMHFILLALSGLLLFWLSRHDAWDWAVSRYWFDSAQQRFPLQNNAWLDLLNHRLLKDAVITGAVGLLLAGLALRRSRWVFVALLIGIGPLVVGVLKATSAHSCPWDLVEFGGKAWAYPLLGSVPADSGPGHCFPGGHASSGFGLMALLFLFWPERKRLAWFLWSAAMLLGLLMGFGQVMRGAHFVSHNLWAGWWVWFSQLSVYAGVTWWMKMRKGTQNGNAKSGSVSLD
ncbi:phosphoesterase [Enterobacterales bacterium CwR94]|nr:phosphoesterase [Enterobacterales bacterium CwR94]